MSTLETNLIQPATGTALQVRASGDTITIPSGATLNVAGTAGTNIGKILQVVTTEKTDTDSTTSTSFNDITGMSVAITPAATSSKILVFVNVHAGWSTNYSASFSLVRDSTQIYLGDASSSRTRAYYGGQTKENRQSFTAGAVYVDSPSTTSATTYKVQWLVESGATLYINRDAGDADAAYSTRSASTITVMEIGA